MDATSEPKISVILTIYKVEPYLRKCLDSIAVQTHRNLEVIMVDDGSPDNCPAICDEYAANDPRFKAIHKENGGIASGYNAGLDAATGDWIGFVDPDDWIEPDMFEYLLAGALRHGVKMAACSSCCIDGRWKKAHTFERERVISGRQGVEMLLEESEALGIGPVLKLCARELWDGIRFQQIGDGPADFCTFELLLQTQALVCMPGVKYYNRIRPGSNTTNHSLSYMLALYYQWEELCSGLFAQEPEFRTTLASKQVSAAWQVWGAYYTAPRDERKAVMPQLREIAAACRPHIRQTAQDHDHIGLAGRIGCRLVAWPTWWSFALSRILWALYIWKREAHL